MDHTTEGEADLHVHTTASDGTWTPEEAVRAAKQAGLRAVAIADHDTVEGVGPAQAAGEAEGVEVLSAVEVNTDFRGSQLHVLGYLFNGAEEAMQQQLLRIREARLDRAGKMVEKLQALGIDVTLAEVLKIAGEGSVGRPHIARALLEKGVVQTDQEAFDRFLLPGRAAFVDRYRLTPTDAVRMIRDSGGVPVMAHPGLTRQEDYIPELIDAGLMGLEVYHVEHTPTLSRHYEKLAAKHHLLITGGSDSHGPNSGRPIPIGKVRLSYEHVQRLKETGSRMERS